MYTDAQCRWHIYRAISDRAAAGAITIPGRYRNVNTGAEYQVTEEQVAKGERI